MRKLGREDVVPCRPAQAFEDDVDQKLPVHRHGESLAHPHVVERRLVLTHDHVHEPSRGDLERGDAGRAGDPGEIRLLDVEHDVHGSGEEVRGLGGQVREEMHLHRVQIRTALDEVVLVLDQTYDAGAVVALQLERAGAVRPGLEIGGGAGEGRGGHDSRVGVGERGREVRVGIRQPEADGQRVHRLDRHDQVEHRARGRTRGRVEDRVHGRDHVVRGERRSVVEGHVRTQVEGELRGVVVAFPGLGEIRNRAEAGAHPGQTGIDHVDAGVFGRSRQLQDVERRDARRVADLEDAAPHGLALRERDSGQGRRGRHPDQYASSVGFEIQHGFLLGSFWRGWKPLGGSVVPELSLSP